jgi:hypothetical protein
MQLTIELLFNHVNTGKHLLQIHHSKHARSTHKWMWHPCLSPKVLLLCPLETSVLKTSGLSQPQKTTALPLGAGFMLNSPMPMLDVSDWLLLMTVSTTGGGRIMVIVFFLEPGYEPLIVFSCTT